jgi:hypothetical protein
MKNLFIDSKYGCHKDLSLPVYNIVKPSQINRFVIHVLLSLGNFNNEGELFAVNSPRMWFRNAKLLSGDGNEPVAIEDINNLTKRVILEQLIFVPNGTVYFDKSYIAAYCAFKTELFENIPPLGLQPPSFLYTNLVNEATPQNIQYMNEIKEKMIDCLCQLPGAPSKANLLKATRNAPLTTHTPTLQQLQDQSSKSYNEAEEVFNT